MKKDDLKRLTEEIPQLGDRKLVMKMIQALYKGFGASSLEQRMSDGFDKNVMSPDDQQTFRRANAMRRARGEKSIVGKYFDIDD
jgi:hypothetical protein